MSSTLAGQVSRPWRRFPRLSVRGLMVVVLVIGGWLGWFIHRVELQRAAVGAIDRGGGFVTYEWEWKDGASVSGGKPRWPKWLVDRVGIDCFASVTRIDFLQPGTNTKIAPVRDLTRLEYLNLVGSRVTDEGLVAIEGLVSLQYLCLGGCKITDAGLAHLKRLTALRYMELGGTKVGDVGLSQIEGFTSLNKLFLGGTGVTNAGLAHLKNLKGLEVLELNNTNVSDSGLVELEGMSSLRTLMLGGTKVTDAGVQKLQRLLPKLQVFR